MAKTEEFNAVRRIMGVDIPVVVKRGEPHGALGKVVGPLDTSRTLESGVHPYKAVPDGEPHARSVEVLIDGEVHNIIPRSLRFATQDDIKGVQVTEEVTTDTVEVEPVGPETRGAAMVDADTARHSQYITDPDHPALDRYRPDPSLEERYISREMLPGVSDLDYFLALYDMKDGGGYAEPVGMVGDTQAGKTMLVQVLAIKLGRKLGYKKPLPVFTLNGSIGITTADLYGMPVPTMGADGKEVLVHMNGLVSMALACPSILYLDEMNAIPPAQSVALHPLLDGRRSFTNYRKPVPVVVDDEVVGFQPEIQQMNHQTWVITTINPNYAGTGGLSEATSNRFRWIPYDYNPHVESKLIPSESLRKLAASLRADRQLLRVPVGTSVFERMAQDARMFGPRGALQNILGLFQPGERRDAVEAIWEELDMDRHLTAEFGAGELANRYVSVTAPTY